MLTVLLALAARAARAAEEQGQIVVSESECLQE